MMMLRFDARSIIEKFERTPQGFLRIPARLSKVGVFGYQSPQGTLFDYRPADEVFAKDSVASTDLMPVTVGHPPENINPQNVRSYKVGQVVGTASRQGDYLVATIQVEDAQTIKLIEDGVLKELSCGYTVKYDEQSGSYKGAKYDRIQRDITLNHVSLLGANQGRQGSDVGLLLDGADLFPQEVEMSKKEPKGEVKVEEPKAVEPEVKADSQEAKPEAKEEPKAVEPEVKESEVKADALPDNEDPAKDPSPEEKPSEDPAGDKPADPEKKSDAQLMLDAMGMMKGMLDQLKDMCAPKEQPKQDSQDIDALVEARSILLAKAQKVHPKLDHKGKTPHEIHVAVLDHLHVKHDGKSEDYIAGLFDLATETQPANPISTLMNRQDSKDATSIEDTRKEISDMRAKRMAGHN